MIKEFFSKLMCKTGDRILRKVFASNRLQSYRDDKLDCINRLMQTNISTMALHQKTFTRFKGVYTGKDVCVIATGPTLKNFRPIPGCIYIGVNSAIKSHVELDYIFAHDHYSVKDLLPEMNQYHKGKCTKFYGLEWEHRDVDEFNDTIPESDAIEAGALRYRTDLFLMSRADDRSRFAYDISTQPLGSLGSTVFAALQFACWTNPKRIYLVGCDCSNTGHFNSPDKLESFVGKRPIDVNAFARIYANWLEFKKFAHRFYPATEIVSINPVGLKGIFTDVYQE